ncbi:S8 family peptidase [Cryptosporangium sp. NPDC051539]|uniref:S8 family peptidase n=1 Tax=Cryptosporangium sp. NPDC051539 TaxID=3363962 RepID=UPI0037B438E0
MPEDPRLIAQVGLVLDHLRGAAPFPAAPRWQEDGLDYLYREHSLFVRRADLETVVPALRSYLRAVLDDREWPPEGGYDPGNPDGPAEEPGEPVALRRSDVEPRIVPKPVIADVVRLEYVHPDWAADDPRRVTDSRVVPLVRVPKVVDVLTEHVVGRGTVRPEAVLYVAPHPCPATEPEEVPRGTHRPFPEVGNRPGHREHGHPHEHGHHHEHGHRCTGRGTSVVVSDLGLDPRSVRRHDWLTGVEGEYEDPYHRDQNGHRTTIRPYAGHGTFVAGCVRVTAPEAEIYVQKYVDPYGAPDAADSGAVFESLAVQGLADALGRSPDVVMFEFTAATKDNLPLMGFDALHESLIRHLPGVAIVTPAGNEGKRDVNWPGAYDWVIAVGALSADWHTRADFSNYGFWVDVYAPGADLVNAYPKGRYVCTEDPNVGEERRFRDGMARWSGTSFSAPLVAGMIVARSSCTGENPRRAAESLLAAARHQHVPGVGPVLRPGQGCH